MSMSLSYCLNGVVSLVGAICLMWVVMDHRINDGIIIKIGLMMMIFSLLVTAGLTWQDSTQWSDYWKADLWLRIGIAVVCFGVISIICVGAR